METVSGDLHAVFPQLRHTGEARLSDGSCFPLLGKHSRMVDFTARKLHVLGGCMYAV